MAPQPTGNAQNGLEWRGLFAKGRDEQAAEFGWRVWPARKLERRAVAEIARIDVGVGARGADNAPPPILGKAEVATLDGQGLETRRRLRGRRELGALEGIG